LLAYRGGSERREHLRKPQVPEGVAALFSCRTGQRSFETDKLGKGHGIFFHHVIEGLKGEARRKDRGVTWSSLVDHVTESVEFDSLMLIGRDSAQQPHQITNLAGRSPVLAPQKQAAFERNLPREPIEGMVTRVENDLVTISIGSDAGLLKGHTLYVFRLG